MSRVAGLYRVGLAVPNLEETARFYETNWAMEPVDAEGGRRRFRSRGQDHSDLVLSGIAPQEQARLDHVALAVRTEKELRDIVARVAQAGHPVLQACTPGRRPEERAWAAVEDLDGNRIELVVPTQAASAAAQQGAGRARHLGHVVLWTPQIEQQEAFYALLGFQVSDRTHIGMSFLRCNHDHHSLALARSSQGRRGLQHVAFDVGGIDEVMREYGRLKQGGDECIWGVGRHGPGNNVFAYYQDPAGNVVEFYGDMETVESPDVPEARYWGPEHKGDIWGVAGGPPRPFRD